MKINKCIFLLCRLAIPFFMVTACATTIPKTKTQQPELTPSTITKVTLPSSPKSTPTITPLQDLSTPVPTISAKELKYLIVLLQSNECKLPCYLGITPGKTTLNEAKAILVSLGGSHVSDYKREDGATEYFYNLWVGDLTAYNDTPEPNGFMVKIIHHISLITNNDTVQIIDVYINATKSMGKFREYWSRYSAREIFLQMGVPDSMFINVTDPNMKENGRRLFIVYENQGVVIQLYGTQQENNICPESEAKFIDLQMSLFDPGSSLSIYPNGRTSKDLGVPIEEAIGITTKEFYNRVVSDPSVCFKPKITTP